MQYHRVLVIQCLKYLQVVTAVSVAIISATGLFVVAEFGLEVGAVRHTGIHSRYHRKILREKITRFFQSKLVLLAQSSLLYGIFYKEYPLDPACTKM